MPDIFVKVQRTENIDPEKITHQPQTYRVLGASGDWVALQGMGGSIVYFRRSTALQQNQSHRIVEGIHQSDLDNLSKAYAAHQRYVNENGGGSAPYPSAGLSSESNGWVYLRNNYDYLGKYSIKNDRYYPPA